MSGSGHHHAAASRFTERPAIIELALGLLPLLAVGVATQWWSRLSMAYLLQLVGLYVALAGLVRWRAPAALRRQGFGAANRVTLLRAGLVLPVIALLPHVEGLDASAAWWVVALTTVALILDGVDGWVARRFGSTRFGARFDMELDALLILGLTLLVWLARRVGIWVILIGALRYLFVLAGWMLPQLQKELPPSVWRKTVCVIQAVALLVVIAPATPPAAAASVAAGALAMLLQSFGADVVWLLREARAAPSRRRSGAD